MKPLLRLCDGLLFCVLVLTQFAPAEELRVVGVLGNTAGMGQPAVPYAFYTGLAVDSHERLWLAGASEGLVCCDQEGKCLAVVPLPKEDRRLTLRVDAVMDLKSGMHSDESL